MARKKLPKAIKRDTPSVTRNFAGAIAQEAGAQSDPEQPNAAVSAESSAGEGRAPPNAALRELLPRDEGSLAVGERSPVESDLTRRRRALARRIVERHAVYSAVSGVMPLAFVNVAAVTAINLRMVKMLSGVYGVPFQRNRSRVMVGLAVGATPTGLAAATASALSRLAPANAVIAIAVSSAAAAACTRAIGRLFVEQLEGSKTPNDSPATQNRETAVPAALVQGGG